MINCRLISSILHLTVVLRIVVAAFSCKNSSIEIYGAIDPLSELFYAAIGPRYTTFRQSYDIHVSIRKETNSTVLDRVKMGLVKSVDNPLTTFVSTPYNVPLHNNEIQFPLFAHGVVILYNLPGITNLNLTPDAVANIYLGNIKYWNDSWIQMQNPNAVLPFKRIIPVVRMDLASTTVFLTNIFSASNHVWNHTYGTFASPQFVGGQCCNSTSWPPNDNYMYGNTAIGMIGLVLSYQYTIGYAVMEAVEGYNVSIAGLLKSNNSLSETVLPNLQSIQRAMYSYLNDNAPDDFDLTSVNSFGDTNAYPLTVFSTVIMNYTYDSSIDCCLIQELVGFIDWFYDTSKKEYQTNEGYFPIIDGITERIKKLVLPKIKCREGPVYEIYLKSLIQETSYTFTSRQIVLVSIVSLLVLILCIVIAACYYHKNKIKNDDSQWLVDSKRIKLLQETDSSYDNNSNKFQSVSSSTSDKKYFEHFQEMMLKVELDDMKVRLNMLNCKLPGEWNATTKKTILKFKNIASRHVARLLGVTTFGPTTYSIFEFSPKGTLHYILKTTRYTLTNDIKQNFALDTARGLSYLHRQKIVHGFLSSLTCYLDSSWTVKITSWEKLSIYAEENKNMWEKEISFIPNSLIDDYKLISFLYVDPNLLKINNENADIFSFGFLLLEIFSRKIPYEDNIENEGNSYAKILNEKFSKNNIIQPAMNEIPNEIGNLFQLCTGTAETRPNMTTILKKLSKKATDGQSIVDIILEMVEKHADMLEEKIEERTGDLKKVTDDMLNLLNEVLPPQIAAQLLAGQTVEPEHFGCVTIYFSDIVGFTTISAKSSPIDVMTFLNDLWLEFDRIIDKFDVYKVDTIGDAYLVCSGLPIKNGNEHCRQIALLALALRNMCTRFKIRHLPNEHLKVRIGINSGPVTAGVVGSKMPQYCIFGDAVNTAARMESTSIAQSIHMSENSYILLKDNFSGQFSTAYRGEIDIKGKGKMKTYWLFDQKSHNEIEISDPKDKCNTLWNNFNENKF